MTIRRVLYIGSFVVLFIGLLPVISVLVAGGIAKVANCGFGEDAAHPCVIFGFDLGESLYIMAMMGWYGLLTLPFAAVAAVVILLLALFDLIRYLRG